MISPADFLAFRAQSRSYEQVAAFAQVDYNMTIDSGEVEPVYAATVTANFFDTLAIKPAAGRAFASGEDREGENQVAVLSYGLWQQRFGGDPRAVGRAIKLNGSSYTVVGVMDKDVRFPIACALWTPFAITPGVAADRDDRYLRVFGRLKPGVSEAQARAELSSIAALLAKNYPSSNRGWSTLVEPLRRYLTGDFNRQYSLLLLGAVFFVLLIACANVMNLQFARMSGRQKEFAVRTALGARRWHLVRQVMLESTLLSFGGAIGSLLLAAWGLDLFVSNMPGEVARYISGWEDIRLDGRALAFTLAIAVFAGLVSGLIPALRAGAGLGESLKQSGRGTSAGRSRQRLRGALVIGEIGAAMVLLAGAGLMIRGSQSLIRVDPNLRPESVLTMQIVLTDKHYGESHQRAAFYDRVMERLAALPGVQTAAVASDIPYGVNERFGPYQVEGQPAADASERRSAALQSVSASFFDLGHVAIVRGRGFGESDGPDSPSVAIVTESFVRRAWPDGNAIGHRIRTGAATPWLTVVGVAKDVRYNPFAREIGPAIYQPYRQSPQYYTYLTIRTKGDPLTLAAPARRAIAALDIDRPVFEVLTLDRVIANELIGLSYVSVILTILGAVAILLAAVGIYSLMAYSVSEQTQEIGIRLALGADRAGVFRMMAKRAALLIGAGLAIGLAVTIPVARLLSSLIYGVGANDPLTFGSVIALLTVVALAACFVPVRRALTVDPIVALRND